MKILFDATPFLFPESGVGQSTRSLFESMLRFQDSEVEWILYSRCLKRSQEELLAHRVSQILHYSLPEVAENLLKSISWLERRSHADLYHGTDHYLPVKDLNKLVLTLHDLVFLVRPEHIHKKTERLARLVPQQAPKARHIISVSESTKNDLVNKLDIPEDRIRVIPWGVDHTRFHPASDPEENRTALRTRFHIQEDFLLAVSCSVERKNTPRLLAAWRRYQADGGSLPLYLAWSPPQEIKTQYASELQQGKLRFLGPISHANLPLLYRSAKAVLYPSEYEGFGLVLLEALACGTPVLTSSTSSMPEVAGGGALYVDPFSVESITEQLHKVEDDKIIDDLVRRGLIQAQSFTWESCARKTLALYREIAA